MKSVYKYELKVDNNITISLPMNAKPLSVQVQHGSPQLWVLVDPNESTYINRTFRLAGTGHEINESNLEFIGTFQLYNGSLVFHLFEVL